MKFSTILLCSINLLSCTHDAPDPITPDPVVLIPTNPTNPTNTNLPSAKLLHPAVVNVRGNITGKSATVTKRLVKTITFNRNSQLDIYYKTKFTDAEYRALPTDNIYDSTEEALNVNTPRYDERIYTYNSSGNLEKITINNIAYPNNNGTVAYAPIVFSYNEAGVRAQVTKYQNIGMIMTYEYNSIGQIIKAFDMDGKLTYTFDYDENNNISSKYLYMGTPNANGVGTTQKPVMHYTYAYYANNTYDKSWITVNPDGTESLSGTVKYTYDRNAAGVYNNEAIYKILMDNQEGLQYLHIISNTSGYKPKYFYDADGYLMKYDSSGLSISNDITLFIYE